MPHHPLALGGPEPAPPERWRGVLRYVFAVVAVSFGLVLRFPFWSVLGTNDPFLMFFPAVMLSAWIGGFGPGLLTAVLSALAARYLFIAPFRTLQMPGIGDLFSLALFIVVGAFMSRITERLHIARRQEEQWRIAWQQTLMSVGDAVIATDKEGVVTFLNRVAEELTGWTLGRARGRPLTDVFHIVNEGTGAAMESPVAKVLREGVTERLANHTELISSDGSRIAIDDSAAPIRDRSGQLIGAVLVFRDITERRRKDRALAESREKLRTTLESITDGFLAMDANWRLTYVNHAAEQILGTSAQELIGKDHWEEYPDARGTIIETSYQRAIAEQKSVHFENYYEPFAKWFEVNAYPAADGGLSVFFRDITQRKETEALARQTEEQLRLLADANVIGILFCDVHGNVRDANDEYLRIIGYTREDLEAGRIRWTDATPPEWLPLDRERLAEAQERGICAPYEKEHVRPDGTRVPVYVGFVLFGSAREDAVAFVIDLSGQKRAEAALRESEANLHIALKASRMGVWTNDLVQKRIHWSPELEEIFGLSPGAFPGTEEAFFSYIHIEDRPAVAHVVERALRDRTDYRVEFRFHKANGELGWMEGRGQAFYSEHGEAVRLAGVGLDITDRKLIESALFESQVRLRRTNEELQQFAYAASHDLKEPLRTVTSYVQLLERRYRDQLDETAREFIAFAVDGTKRMRELVEALLDYSRAGEVTSGEPSSMHLDDALERSLSGLKTAMDESGAIVTHGELPEIVADPMLLTQLLQNIVGNALKYAKPGHAPRVHVSARMEGSCWVISVRDNGRGIAPEDQDRIFGVFQRLHGGEVSGTGIGLATCKKIVERWGGRIWVESQLGEGATFLFTIPASAEQMRAVTMAR